MSSASSQPLPSRHPDGLLQEAEQFTPPAPFIASPLPLPCETKGNALFFFFCKMTHYQVVSVGSLLFILVFSTRIIVQAQF